jgi:hypothetical protein
MISVHQVHPGDRVPNAPGPDVCVAMYSAVVLAPGGGLVAAADGSRSLTDISFVEVGPSDTTATVQAAVLAAVKAAYNDNTLTAQYL